MVRQEQGLQFAKKIAGDGFKFIFNDGRVRFPVWRCDVKLFWVPVGDVRWVTNKVRFNVEISSESIINRTKLLLIEGAGSPETVRESQVQE